MEIDYTDEALEHLKFWKKSGNKTIQKKIINLLNDIVINPFSGIGKPEELKYEWSGYWSRRINQEHRIIYKIEKDRILIYSLKGHYNNY